MRLVSFFGAGVIFCWSFLELDNFWSSFEFGQNLKNGPYNILDN